MTVKDHVVKNIVTRVIKSQDYRIDNRFLQKNCGSEISIKRYNYGLV